MAPEDNLRRAVSSFNVTASRLSARNRSISMGGRLPPLMDGLPLTDWM